MKRERGVTLLEAMVVVSIAAILAVLAVPGMLELIWDARQEASAMDMYLHLNYARSESIRRGYRVAVCPSRDGASCLGAAIWESGWIVFADLNSNGIVDGAETILRAHGKLDEGSTMRGSRQRITYQSTGFSPGYNDTLKLCDVRGAARARSVVINMVGRVRVVTGAASCP
jgi:type IV fimbrial biogenesis protein FimT